MRFKSRSPNMWLTFLKIVKSAGYTSPPREFYVQFNYVCLHDSSATGLQASSSRPSVSASSFSPLERHHLLHCTVVTLAHSYGEV